jgi:Tfp pilus assembly protein PilO
MPRYLLLYDLFKKYEVITSSVLVILTTIVLSFTILFPNFSRAATVFENEKVLKKRLTQLQAKYKDLQNIEYLKYKDTMPKIAMVLPYDKNFVSLFNRFDQLQFETGVTILRTDFQLGIISTNSASFSKATVKGQDAIPMTLEIIGTKDQVTQFLTKLSDLSGRLITIKDVQWSQKDSQTDAAINGIAYFSLPLTTIGNIDSPLPILNKRQQDIFSTIQQSIAIENPQDEIGVEVGKKDIFK